MPATSQKAARSLGPAIGPSLAKTARKSSLYFSESARPPTMPPLCHGRATATTAQRRDPRGGRTYVDPRPGRSCIAKNGGRGEGSGGPAGQLLHPEGVEAPPRDALRPDAHLFWATWERSGVIHTRGAGAASPLSPQSPSPWRLGPPSSANEPAERTPGTQEAPHTCRRGQAQGCRDDAFLGHSAAVTKPLPGVGSTPAMLLTDLGPYLEGEILT